MGQRRIQKEFGAKKLISFWLKMTRFIFILFPLLSLLAAPASAGVEVSISHQPGQKNIYAVPLPPAKGLKTASDAVLFLEGGQDGVAHSKTRMLMQWDARAQVRVFLFYDEEDRRWKGHDFKLKSYLPLWVQLVPGSEISYSVNVPRPGMVTLAGSKGQKRNWLVLSEGSGPKKASQLLQAFGGPSFIIRVGKWNPAKGTEIAFSGKNKANGVADFLVKEGEAYFIDLKGKGSRRVLLP
jgi:hypothetical protein